MEAETVAEAASVEAAEEAEVSDAAVLTTDHAKCIRLLAAHVAMKEKFLSNHEAVHPYSAEIASQSRRAVQAVHTDHATMLLLENHKNQATLNKHV